MAFSKLPKLKAPEPTQVTARVINTFYKPEKEPLDGTPLILAESLEGFNKGLTKYIADKEIIKEEVDTKKAQADYNKNRAEFRTLVKNGKVPEGASPYYINAYVNAELRDKARDFEREVFSQLTIHESHEIDLKNVKLFKTALEKDTYPSQKTKK